jgi:glutamate N-acetyltransferase/amino-acid N-acetyltransferase
MKGFRFKGIHAGIKKDGGFDLGLIHSEKPATAAALFTRNRVKAAPVVLGMERIRSGLCQAVLVNSGNANCFTGEKGLEDARVSARIAAHCLGIPEALVMVASTGVIGAPLPMEILEKGIREISSGMSEAALEDFARAIMTTDKAVKISERQCVVKGKAFSIQGVAKGSGMIKPDMATMLAFVMTDLYIPAPSLKACLKIACEKSFNRISVDGDTSTNDMVLALANGASQAVLEDSDDSLEFQKALDEVLLDLATMIVRDGEGATKLVKITVTGARTPEDALAVARAVSESNLVKTAIYGEDPNWGRITAAAGRSGAYVEPERMDLLIGDAVIVRQGVWLGKEAERKAAVIMKQPDLDIRLDLNLGQFSDAVYFCDFSEDYVRINADYRS